MAYTCIDLDDPFAFTGSIRKRLRIRSSQVFDHIFLAIPIPHFCFLERKGGLATGVWHRVLMDDGADGWQQLLGKGIRCSSLTKLSRPSWLAEGL